MGNDYFMGTWIALLILSFILGVIALVYVIHKIPEWKCALFASIVVGAFSFLYLKMFPLKIIRNVDLFAYVILALIVLTTILMNCINHKKLHEIAKIDKNTPK